MEEWLRREPNKKNDTKQEGKMSSDQIPLCVPAQSLRALMSSIMRWRNELTESVLMENSCLG
jgi:hypothetical protein